MSDLSPAHIVFLNTPRGATIRKKIMDAVVIAKERAAKGYPVHEKFILEISDDFPVTDIPAIVAFTHTCFRKIFGAEKEIHIKSRTESGESHESNAAHSVEKLHIPAAATPLPQKTQEGPVA